MRRDGPEFRALLARVDRAGRARTPAVTCMNCPARRVGFGGLLALMVCVGALALAACGGKEPTRNETITRYSQELREAVSTSVPEEARKEQMLQIVSRVEALQLRFSQETTDFVASYRKLNADYDATRPSFEQLFSEYRAKRSEARSEALALHFQLASLATASEWDRLGKAEAKLYEEVNAARSGENSNK